jgi:predicted unusual protein kinase regulating ubiquinone biosynthesis (AarF/ABC1/UbiB family)
MAEAALEQAQYLFSEYRDIIREMPFQFPTDILFVGRAMGVLSGMATTLDPDFDLWAATIPFAERLAADELPRDWRAGLDEIGNLARLALALPARIERLLTRAERGELSAQASLAPDLARALQHLDRGLDRLSWSVIAAALLIAWALVRSDGNSGQAPTVLLAGAALVFLWGLIHRG